MILVFIILLLIITICSADRCLAANFKNIVVTGDEDYLIYGITPVRSTAGPRVEPMTKFVPILQPCCSCLSDMLTRKYIRNEVQKKIHQQNDLQLLDGKCLHFHKNIDTIRCIVLTTFKDCQMFFARPSQIHLLSNIRINKQYLFCSSSLVQFHLQAHNSLVLTFKQAHNRICTLEVQVPSLGMIFGDHLFRYSLLNSLPYAACSHTLDRSFSLEPDLSFMDPVYRDVIYFVDALSKGTKWRVLQFALKETGTLSMMNNLTMRNGHLKENTEASDFLLTIDNRRDKLFRRNKLEDVVDFQCGYELLFKPDIATVKKFKTPTKYGNLVNGQSIEEDIMVYVETDRTSSSGSRLKILNIDQPDDVYCLASTNFAFDVGILRQSSLDYLENNPLPQFGTKMRSKQKHTTTTITPPKTKAVKTTTKQVAKISTTTPESIKKSKDAYSPSKSFFSFETTMGSLIDESDDNAVEFSEEEENQMNEIVRELSTDMNEDGFRDANLTRRYADNETIIESDAVKNVEKLFVSHIFSLVILFRLAFF